MIGQKTKLTLQKFSSAADGMGGFTETFITSIPIKGVMEAVRGSERFYGETRTLFATHKFHIDFPHTVTITEKDRFLKGTQIYEIVFIDNVAQQNRFLEITIKEIR